MKEKVDAMIQVFCQLVLRNFKIVFSKRSTVSHHIGQDISKVASVNNGHEGLSHTWITYILVNKTLKTFKKLCEVLRINKKTEGVGFEPTGRVNAQRFSRPPLSAAQPSLRIERVNTTRSLSVITS